MSQCHHWCVTSPPRETSPPSLLWLVTTVVLLSCIRLLWFVAKQRAAFLGPEIACFRLANSFFAFCIYCCFINSIPHQKASFFPFTLLLWCLFVFSLLLFWLLLEPRELEPPEVCVRTTGSLDRKWNQWDASLSRWVGVRPGTYI